ncbi:MAG: CoA transferase [Dehalococcoidia bacterium]
MTASPTPRTDTAQPHGPLAGPRVLDFTLQIAGPFCTKLLADYGAEVIKIERPAGDPARHIPALFQDEPDAEGSHFRLQHEQAQPHLDLKSDRGRRLALDLAVRADVVVESFRPGVMDRLGLGYEMLATLNPRLVMTSISNFGQSGPYRDLEASELVEYAMSGMMAISGSSEREPLKHGLSQAQYAAGINAAYMTAGLAYNQALGLPGQWIDVSVHEAVTSQMVANLPYYAWVGGIQGRRPASGDGVNNLMRARDGWVVLQTIGPREWSVFPEFLGVPELNDPKFADPRERLRHTHELDELVGAALAKRDKRELFIDAAERRILFGVAQDPADLLGCPQLNARGFFIDIDHPRTGPLRYAGEPIKMSRTPWQLRRPAPLLGQHTDEVLSAELGLSAEAIERLRVDGVV